MLSLYKITSLLNLSFLINPETSKGSLSKSQKLWKIISDILKTPHYIIKGNDFIGLKKQMDSILLKHYKA